MATTTGGPFVLNIVDLQNTVTSASGLNPVTTLSNTVAQLQEMLIYDEKRLAVNTISKYNQSPIQVVDAMNFGGAVTINGASVGGTSTTQFSQTGSIGNVSSFTNYYNTLGAGSAITFQVGSPAAYPLTISGTGTTTIAGGLSITGAGAPGVGYYLTCLDTAGTAEWAPPGSVSDARWKMDIQPIHNYRTILHGLRGVRFRWIGTGEEDVGVIAQEVAAVLPEAVVVPNAGGPNRVEYHKIIPVLIESIKGLEARVAHLEGLVYHK